MDVREPEIERFATVAPFVIARGPKSFVDVVTVEVVAGDAVGRGEGTPIYYRDDTAARAAALLAAGAYRPDRMSLIDALPAGAARNALDCALWDLEAALAGVPVWRLAGLHQPKPLVTARTLSLGEPGAMAAAASSGARALLKLKLGGDGGDRERVAAVRAAAPGARLIADANESWGGLDLEAEAAALGDLGVELIEQPVPAGSEHLLDRVRPRVPFCADESCQTRADLDVVAPRFGAVNIKLDKAGGLTEALALAAEARARGLAVMVGCMLGTSRAIAPAWALAVDARWADLDGAQLLAADRVPGMIYDADGTVRAARGVWGGF